MLKRLRNTQWNFAVISAVLLALGILLGEAGAFYAIVTSDGVSVGGGLAAAGGFMVANAFIAFLCWMGAEEL